MFAIVGQVERDHRGHEAFQEIDQVATIGGLAKWAVEPATADDVPAAMTDAMRHALAGRPGPVLISLSEDLLDEPAPTEARIDGGRSGPPRPTDDDVRAAIELLASARRPVILAGGGVLRARTSTDLLRFATLLQVPDSSPHGGGATSCRTTTRCTSAWPASAPRPSCVSDCAAADAMLVIGSRLNEPTSGEDTIPALTTRWIHVDIEPAVHAGPSTPERTVTADARIFLRAANDRLVGKAVLDAERVKERQTHNAADRAAWEAATIVDGDAWDGPGVHPARSSRRCAASCPTTRS